VEQRISERQYNQAKKSLLKLLDQMELSDTLPQHEVVDVKMMLVTLYKEQQKYADARTILLQLLKLDELPETQNLYIRQVLAEIHLRLGDHDTALPDALLAEDGINFKIPKRNLIIRLAVL
jgi:two-component SAPR family response regulator